jgi:hypothetical protein
MPASLGPPIWPRLLSCGHTVRYRVPPTIGAQVWCLRCDKAVVVASIAAKEPT